MSLTAKELAAMRNVSNDFLPDTCTIQGLTETIGSAGDVQRSYSTLASNVPCRLDPESNQTGETLSNLAPNATPEYMLNIPYTQAINETDRVIVNGITYAVENVADNHSYDMINRATVKPI